MSKKLLISRNNLPDINAFTGTYDVRFRITTEDRNRFSYWSPIFRVDPQFDYISGQIDISKSSNHVNIIWDAVSIERNGSFVSQAQKYDIWIRWSKNNANGDWIYKERIEGTSVSVVIPSTYTIDGIDQETAPNRITVEIFLRGRPITRESTVLRVYNPPMQTI
jgi:hypothetical protein